MKKKLTLIIALALVVVMAVGGTLAYFTDKDQNTNEFTVGGIKIDLYETVGQVDGAGNEKMEVQEEQGKGDDTNPGIKYKDIMPGDVMTKVVTVENKENYPVYVALAIKQDGYQTFNKKIDAYYEPQIENGTLDMTMQEITDAIFTGDGWNGLSYDKKSNGFGIRYYPKNVTADNQDGDTSYVGNDNETPVLIAVDYTYTGVNEATGYKDNMLQTKRHSDVTSYSSYYALDTGAQNRMWVYYLYMPDNTSYELDLTVTCPTFIDANSIAAFDNMKIDVCATAIQVDGFKTAKEAFRVLADTYKFGFGN